MEGRDHSGNIDRFEQLQSDMKALVNVHSRGIWILRIQIMMEFLDEGELEKIFKIAKKGYDKFFEK